VLVDNSAQAISTFIKNDLGLQFDLSAYTIFGILLILLMYLMPQGIVGGVYILVQPPAPRLIQAFAFVFSCKRKRGVHGVS